MRSTLITMCALLLTLAARAQQDNVGINTANPIAELHVVGDSILLVSPDESKVLILRNDGADSEVKSLGDLYLRAQNSNVILQHISSDQAVAIGTASPNPNAKLDVSATGKGILIPRMDSTERQAIVVSPADEGLLVYDDDLQTFMYYSGAEWLDLGADRQLLSIASDTLSISSGNKVDLSPYLDDTDAQDLELSGNMLSLTNDGTPVNLSVYLDNTDNQLLSLSGQDLAITSGNVISLPLTFERSGTTVRPISGYDTDDFVFGREMLPDMGVVIDTLLFFDKSSGSFRSGNVNSDAWSPGNLGFGSAAFGLNAKASGLYSFAAGSQTTASGGLSTALGANTTASGPVATALGFFSSASADFSFAAGYFSVASGYLSTAFGHNTLAVSGYETVFGSYNTSYVPLSTTTWEPGDRLFVVGNGLSAGSRSDALRILKDGTVSFQYYTFPNIDGSTGQVLKTDGTGHITWLDDLDNQGLSISSDSLLISGGNKVDLSPYLDNTDGQTLGIASDSLSISSGNKVDLSPYLDNTDIQDLSLAANSLSLTNDGTPVDLSGYLDNTDAQTLLLSGSDLTISGGNTIALPAGSGDNQTLSIDTDSLTISGGNQVYIGNLFDNTDEQTLSRDSDSIYISNGNQIYIADFYDDTDNQTLSIDPDSLTISGGNRVYIGNLFDNTDEQTLGIALDSLSISSGNKVDLSPYLDNTDAQDLSLSSNTLSLTNDGTPVDLSGYLDNTDAQDLTLSGNDLGLTNDGTPVDLSGYLDNTDAQTLTLSGSDLTISGGNTITLPGGGTSVFEKNGTVVRPISGYAADDLVFGSSALPNGTSQSDTLFYFDKSKGAFRTGILSASGIWGGAFVGKGSMAWGVNTRASTTYSTAWGIASEATGIGATAWGNEAVASAQYATAWGGADATGFEATAWGSGEASATGATAFGIGTASGAFSTAFGNFTEAQSAFETVIGGYNTLYTPNNTGAWDAADRLFVVGNGTSSGARSNALTILKNGEVSLQHFTFPNADGTANQVLQTDGSGQLQWADAGTNQTLSISNDTLSISDGNSVILPAGGGSGAFERSGSLVRPTTGYATDDFVFGSDALPPAGVTSDTLFFFDKSKGAFRVGTVQNFDSWSPSKIGLWSFASGQLSEASGAKSTAMGFFTKATGSASTALGASSVASGSASTAMGGATLASGDNSTAMGSGTTASGDNSTALGANGNTASGLTSFAAGSGNTASGDFATAIGRGVYARSAFEVAIGRFNTDYTPASTSNWDENDRLFVVGNGTHPLPAPIVRSDALIILKNGEVSFQHYTFPNADGTTNQVMKTDGSGQLTWSSDADEQTLTRTTDSIQISSGNTVSIVPDMLQDADGNTGIEAEQSANEDQLRFRTGGTERLVIDDAGVTHINDVMRLTPRGTAPSSPATGTIYYDSGTNKVRVWTGSAWEDLN